MCGIAGFVANFAGEHDTATTLARMTGILRHRGPDDSDLWSDGTAFLGHRRLSIVDLATGHQPMSNEDGDLWIVYNGEIFNHEDLRPGLEQAGHLYRSRSDTETILHAYEQYGAACVERFRGMFAFAVWDKQRRRLFCARDRLGIKPFYYYWDGRLFAFASEIKALLEHPSIQTRFEESVLPEYLAFGYISDERTFFRGIRKLMPGHVLELDAAAASPRLEIRQYWDAPVPVKQERDDESWIRECRARLEETVRMRLMSDVPLGAFLSGGVDSSAIVALMKRMVSGRVVTFSVGYAEGEFSELDYARRVAQALDTEHREVVVSRDDFFGALPSLVWHEDEPIVWPSSVSLYFVAKLAAEHVKVVLTGEGSDELFGGYSRYHFYTVNQQWLKWYRIAPPFVRRGIRDWIAASRLLGATARRKLQHTFLGQAEDLESLYLDNFYSAFGAAAQGRLLRRPDTGVIYANYRRYWSAREDASPLARLLYADQKTYLIELLMKQDQMSMACSIESRVPLLDHPLVEFAAQAPDRMKVRNGEGKYIFKRAVEDLLPREIIYRKKMGFPTPLRQWLSGAAGAQQYAGLRAPDAFVAEFLDRAELNTILDRHEGGVEDATDRIWRLMNLDAWGEIFIKGNREAVERSVEAQSRT
jgi:asparagine synthase (glutamine-hydrolysing)